MHNLSSSRASVLAILSLALASPVISWGGNTGDLQVSSEATPSGIVIGFVGGFVDHDNPHHGPVILARQIKRSVPRDTYVQVFENRHRKSAYETVVRLLDTNHDGVLSPAEKARARIVLFGHSWGAAAAVLLARDLQRQNIPVLMTVQVDSVAKVWQNDSLIPENVSQAVNFYQTQGFIHGRRQIVAADPTRTEILGNYRMDYRKDPVECPDSPWWYRVFTPGHMQSECDPHLWSQIRSLVTQKLSPQPASASVAHIEPQSSR